MIGLEAKYQSIWNPWPLYTSQISGMDPDKNTYMQEQYEDSLCQRCGCCDTEWEDCWKCGGEGGRDDEDLMAEDPLWYSPGDFETCDVCDGHGGWNVCVGGCDEDGKH